MADNYKDSPIRLIFNKKSGNADFLAFMAGLKVFAFLVLCTIGTFFFFMTSRAFVQEVIEEKYGKISQNNVELLTRELGNMQSALITVASMDSDQEKKALRSDKFDEIIEVEIYSNKTVRNKLLFKKDTAQAEPSFTISDYQRLYSNLYNPKIPKNQKFLILTSAELFESNGNYFRPNYKVSPFALSMRTEKAGVSQFIVATANIGDLFSEYWLQDNGIARMTIRDIDTGTIIHDFDKSSEKTASFSSVHEFNFAGKKWEVRAEFISDPVTHKLSYLPYFILYFGGFIALGGLLALYNTQVLARRVRTINRTLEQKNEDLKKEIEKRRMLDKELGATEREKRAIVDAVSDIIFETNIQGKILFLNATWSKITGFTIEQSLGTEIFKMLHPQDQEQQERDFLAMVQGKKAAYTVFTRLRTSDGTFRAIELAISMIRQDEDKNLRVVGTMTDVEQRERAEKALREAEKKYRTIVENAAGGIFQMTPEGVFLSSNIALARILGYENPEELIKKVKDVHREIYLDIAERKKFLHELETMGTIINHEVQIRKKDGSTIWINENARVVRDDEGNTLYYEGSMEDVTSRKESDFALREAKMHSDMANRAKSEFLANMSHELRTPLNAIIGFSEIIKNEVFGKIEIPEYKEYVTDIHRSGKNLLKIINEILDIAKIEANERQLQEDVVELGPLVDDCLEILKTKIAENQLLVSKPYESMPHIVAENIAVKQMIINVLSNAVKFTPAKGHITIDREIDYDGSLRLSITDTGIGLDPSEIPKILSPFGQLENPFNRKHGGTGLGLTLVNSLMKLHSGSLEILSQKGIGTTVTLIFPRSRILQTKEKERKTTSFISEIGKPLS